MRIVMTSVGSMGDVEPMVALADELRRHQHEVVFALPAHQLPFVRRRGFESMQLGPTSLGEVYQRAARAYEYGEENDEEARYYAALMAAAPQALQDLCELCAGAELLIARSIMPLGRIAHELTGIPFISVQLQHPTDQIPMPPELNNLRAQIGLPPVEDSNLHGASAELMLVGVDREMLPADYDPPPHYQITGFWLPAQEDWQPEPELSAFMRSGPAPVVVTLGSMMHADPARLTQLFLETIQAVGCRAIIQHGWTGLAKDIELPPTVYAVDYVPHAWLFPRAACIVYHGGGGTTAATLRAGVPTIVIPSNEGVDGWAQQAYSLGFVGAVIPYHMLTAERLREALAATLAEPRYRDTAAEISQRLRDRSGVQVARELIDAFMERAQAQQTR